MKHAKRALAVLALIAAPLSSAMTYDFTVAWLEQDEPGAEAASDPLSNVPLPPLPDGLCDRSDGEINDHDGILWPGSEGHDYIVYLARIRYRTLEPIPEPPSLILVAIGFAAFFMERRHLSGKI